jgi:hypothetical protein
MTGFRETACNFAAALVYLFGFAALASAQFETRAVRPVNPNPDSITVGDFNHDGKLDIAEVGVLGSQRVAVYLGNGDGTFQSATGYAVGERPSSIAVADFNRDGKLDLVVANSDSNTVSILLGNGDGTFQPAMNFATTPDPFFVGVGDFNNDGKADLITANMSNNSGYCDCVSVLLGNGDGTFQVPAIVTTMPLIPEAVGIGHFDGGKNLDLTVTQEFGGTSQIQILLGNGDGTFRLGPTYPVGPSPISVAVADFNGDHKLDLAVAENGGIGVGVFLGNGDGTFQRRVDYPTNFPSWIVAADMYGRGIKDLVVANLDFFSGFSVLRGNGDGTFGSATYLPDGGLVRTVAVGDFNGDHQPDVLVSDDNAGQIITVLNTGVTSFSPTTPLRFHQQAVGTTSAPLAVTLTNNGATALTISSIKVTGQFSLSSSTTCGQSVAPGGNCEIRVTFSPTSVGVKTGIVSIRDSASSKAQFIMLSGTGN